MSTHAGTCSQGWLWLAVATGVVVLSGGAIAGGLLRTNSLWNAYQQAAATSPGLAASRAMWEADQAGVAGARSTLFPRLGVNAAVGRGKTEVTGFGPAKIDESYDTRSYGAALTQPLLRASDTALLRAAHAEADAGGQVVEKAAQTLMLDVASAYFGVLDARGASRTAGDTCRLLNAVLDQAAAAHRVGAGDIVAVQEARARYDAALSGVVISSNTVLTAERRLARLIHQPVGVLLDLGVVQPQRPAPEALGTWMRDSVTNHPAVRRAQAVVRERAARAQAARHRRWPRVDAIAQYNYGEGAFLPALEREEIVIGIQLTVPIYEGGRIEAEARQASALERAGLYELDATRDAVALGVEIAFLNVGSSASELKAAEQALYSAAVVRDAMQKAQAAGTRTVVDVLDSVQAEADARARYLHTRYRHILAGLRMKAAAGVLSEADMQAVSAMMVAADSGDGCRGKDGR